MKKCEYKFPLLTPEIPSGVCYGKELSSSNDQSSFLSCTTSGYPASLSKSNFKLSDSENLSFDIINPVSVENSDETKIIEDLISDMVSFTEARLGKKDADVCNVSETDSLKFQVFDTPVSASLKSINVDINSSKIKMEQAVEDSILKECFKDQFGEENALNLRTDAKVRHLQFDDFVRQSEMGGVAKIKESESLRDLYFEYFVENFNKEEMEYRWGRYEPSVRRRYYQNSPRSKSGVENGLKYEKVLQRPKIKKTKAIAEIEPVDVIINQNSLQGLAKENFVTEGLLSDTCDESLKTSSENIDYNFGDKVLKENVVNEATSKQTKVCGNITTENISRRNSFNRIKDLEQETNISLCDTDDDEVVLERAVKMIRAYRNICSFIERFFVRPFASVIAECIDLVIFVLVMGFCLFYLFYENVVEKKLKFSYKFQLPCNKMFGTRNRIMESNYDGSLLNKMNSEVLKTEETEENGFKFTEVNKEIDTNAIDRNIISFIDPTDVLKISSSESEEESCHFEKFLLKSEEFLELFKRERRTALITSYENCSIDIILKEDMLNENDFNVEIVALSQKLGNKLYESRDRSLFKVFKNAFKLNINPREDKKALDSSVVYTDDEKALTSNIKSVDSRQDECSQNSTKMEDTKLIARAASGSSSGSDFNLLSFSCADLLSSGTVQSPSNENLVFCSSLNMDLPSFNSGLDVNLLNNSLSTSDTTKYVYDIKTSSLNDGNVIQKVLEVNGDKSSAEVNFSSIGSEDLVKIQIGENTGDSLGVKNKTCFRKISPKRFKLKSLKRLQISCQQELEYTKFNSPNNAAENQGSLCTQFDNLDSVASEFVEFFSNDNSDCELDSLMDPPVLPREKRIFKSNGNLRRRMSSIFNGWKNTSMVQRVTGNLKNKGYPNIKMSKKHNKHLEKP